MYGRLTGVDPVPVDRALSLVVGRQDEVTVAVVPIEVVAEQPDAGGDVAARLVDAHRPAEHRLADPLGRSGHQLHDADRPGVAHDALLPPRLLPGHGQRERSRNAVAIGLAHDDAANRRPDRRRWRPSSTTSSLAGPRRLRAAVRAGDHEALAGEDPAGVGEPVRGHDRARRSRRSGAAMAHRRRPAVDDVHDATPCCRGADSSGARRARAGARGAEAPGMTRRWPAKMRLGLASSFAATIEADAHAVVAARWPTGVDPRLTTWIVLGAEDRAPPDAR